MMGTPGGAGGLPGRGGGDCAVTGVCLPGAGPQGFAGELGCWDGGRFAPPLGLVSWFFWTFGLLPIRIGFHWLFAGCLGVWGPRSSGLWGLPRDLFFVLARMSWASALEKWTIEYEPDMNAA